MSYASVWAGKIAARVESGDYAAAHEVSTDDTGCSTTLEYALARAVDTLFAECTSLRLRAESAERERDELTKRMKFEVIREIKHGRTAVNFGHIPAVSRALGWLCSDITHMDLPIKERP